MPDQEDNQAAPQQEAPAGEVQEPTPDVTDPAFDWDKFFGTPAPVAEIKEEPEEKFEVFEDEAANKLVAEVAAMKKQNAEIVAKQVELERETRLDKALEAWKAQASPAELALADLLYRSKSPEELKANEALVKAAAAKVEATYKDEIEKTVKQKEREMQQAFGVPVPPSFQPIPRADKAKEALDAGDLDKAASIMLEGLFTP